MTEAQILIKYNESLQKIASESTIFGLMKIPNICDRFMDRLIKYIGIVVSLKNDIKKEPKKCIKFVKKLESSPEYIDLLENCLVHKLKEIDKIFKKYPKTGKKLIAMAKKMISILEKKIEKMDKNNERKMQASMVLIGLNGMKEKIKNLTSENERFESFLKKNKKALSDLKKNDVRAYITFYIVRYPLGCFELP